MPKLILRNTVLPVLLALSVAVHAEKPKDWNEGELALAAPYCIDTMGFKYGDATTNRSPKASYWLGLMGPGFWSMHHYCGAMINLRRASTATERERVDLYGRISDDLHYVVKNSPADFVMLPEVFSRIGEVDLLLNKPKSAAIAFERARRQRPDYESGYTHWARYQAKLGMRGDALRLVSEGLSHAPRSKQLLDLYRQLGGDPANLPTPVILEQNPSASAPVSLSKPELPADAPASAAAPASAPTVQD